MRLADALFSVQDTMEQGFGTGMPDTAPQEEIFDRSVFIRGRNNHALKGIRTLAVRSGPHVPFDDIRGFFV